MRTARTLDGIEYAPGAQFRVIKEGTRLIGMVPIAPHTQQGWGQALKSGDIVTCTGFGPGWGSDPGYGVEFTTPESITAHAGSCQLIPSTGGMWAERPAPGILEPAS